MTDRRADIGARKPWREVVADGVQLAFNDEGSGPPIVCLHAIGHGAGDYADSVERWRDHYRVIALDWPGQGRSGADHHPASAGRYLALRQFPSARLEKFPAGHAAHLETPAAFGRSVDRFLAEIG